MDLSTTVRSVGGSDQTWLASAHGIGSARTRTLDISKFTAGTHYDATTKVLKSGIGIAKITATGLYGPYDTTATDGRQTSLDSFIVNDESLVLADGSTSTRTAVAATVHSIINAPRLPIAAQRPGGASDVTTATTTGKFVFES